MQRRLLASIVEALDGRVDAGALDGAEQVEQVRVTFARRDLNRYGAVSTLHVHVCARAVTLITVDDAFNHGYCVKKASATDLTNKN